MQIESKQSIVKRLILQLIRDTQMKPGDKLPGQSVLRARFHCGGVSYTSAIAELCEEGVLVAHAKKGVYLLDSSATTQYSRRIGIICGHLSNNLTLSLKLAFMEESLNRRNCRPIVFHQSPSAYNKLYNSMDDIPTLRTSLMTGELDGIISTIYMDTETEQYLKDHGIFYLYNCGLRLEDNNADIDYPSMIRRSVSELVSHGIKKIAFFFIGRTSDIDWNEPFVQSFKEAMLEKGMECTPEHLFPLKMAVDGQGYNLQICDYYDKILALPKENRPDGIIILDDILTLFLQMHIRTASEWQPIVVSMLKTEVFFPINETSIGHWRLSVHSFVEFFLDTFMNCLKSQRQTTPWHGYLPPLVVNSSPLQSSEKLQTRE